MDTIVQIKNVGFLRGERKIVSDVNWTIETGQHWAMLGANGAGKTTLLKIITGYEWPSNGSVEVLGNVFRQCNIFDVRKSIGYASNALSRRLPYRDTAADIVASGLEGSLGLYRQYTHDEHALTRSTLALLNAETIADQNYETLSQGEQQRVQIARALVNKPGLLILDEPCAGLDPASRCDLLTDLETMLNSAHAPTIIFVTHHIEEICPWISHVLLLKAGKVLAAGATSQMLTDSMLSETFDRNCTVAKVNSHYRLDM